MAINLLWRGKLWQDSFFQNESAPNNIEHIKILDSERLMKKYAYQQLRNFQLSRKTVKDFELDQRIAKYLQWKTMRFLEHTLLGYLIPWSLHLSLSLNYFTTLQIVDSRAAQIILFYTHAKLSSEGISAFSPLLPRPKS